MDDFRWLGPLFIWAIFSLATTRAIAHDGDDGSVGLENPAATILLRNAAQAAARGEWPEAAGAMVAAIEDPTFPSLDEASRHLALALGAQASFKSGKFEEAHRLAVRATQMPEADVDDWQMRLSVAEKMDDARDEAECVATIVRSWGISLLPDSTVFRVLTATRREDFADARLDVLQALYQRRWHPAEGATASTHWRELTRLLLDRGEVDRASDVASLVDEPDDIIAMQVDLRFRPVLKSHYVNSDPRRAMGRRIDSLRKATAAHPRSLGTLLMLLNEMTRFRMDSEVLALTEQVAAQMREMADGTAYDDTALKYNWILDARARALRHLGRYDEAVEQLQQAVRLPKRADTVSQPINLATLLCELGRADEALALLPSLDHVSSYGRMQIASIRLTAARALADSGKAEKELAYLREHRLDAPATFQHALSEEDAQDEAEEWLVFRLNDPSQRTDALLEMQHYNEPSRPALPSAWHGRYVALLQRPAVRAALLKVGRTDQYLWRTNTYQ